jgi:LacI family transcriptional regulator
VLSGITIKNTSFWPGEEMAREHLIKDIAFQAGLSAATVDRVINARGGVRRQTELRVRSAMEELERQMHGLAASSRKLAIDVVMEAPDRFTREARGAFESEAAAYYPAVFRSRFQLAEFMPHTELAQSLDKIRLRGSDGVVVKAPDVPSVSNAIDRLEAAGIPVVTLVTDLPASRRSAYAGMDNRTAGATAAFLIGKYLEKTGGKTLVTLSSAQFRGEEERELGFRSAMRERFPGLGVVKASEGFGRDEATGAQVRAVLAAHPDVGAVYSIGGGNNAVIKAFEDAMRSFSVYVAHDLDDDNRLLLAAGKLTFVLHHDLRTDIRSVFRTILEQRRILRGGNQCGLSAIEVITPLNVPPR